MKQLESDSTLAHKLKHLRALLKSPGDWKRLKRREKVYLGEHIFHEQWVSPSTDSGIVFYSVIETEKRSRLVFVVEGYGVGTIDPKTFREKGSIAPIQRYEFESETDAVEGLAALQEFNFRFAKGEDIEQLRKEFPQL